MPDQDVIVVSCHIEGDTALETGQQLVERAFIPALTQTCADCTDLVQRTRLLGGAMASLVGLMSSAIGGPATRTILASMHGVVDALEAEAPAASALH